MPVASKSSRTTGSTLRPRKGPSQVLGGTYRNNHVSQVRLSGPDCRVYGAYIEVDVEAYSGPGSPEEYRNARGIWWEAKRRVATGGVVEYTTVRILSGPSSGGTVVAPNGGTITVRRSIVEIDVPDTPGIYADPPTGGVYEVPPRPWRVRLETVHVYGVTGVPAVTVLNRPRSVVSDSCIAGEVVVTGSTGDRYLARAEELIREISRFVGAQTGCLDREVGLTVAQDVPRPVPRAAGSAGATPLLSVAVQTALFAAVLGIGALVALGLFVAIARTVRSLFDGLR